MRGFRLSLRLFSLFLSLLVVSQMPISNVGAVIYGADDRRDIKDVPNLKPVAQAVAIAVGKILLEKNADGTTRIDAVDRFSDFICSGERFINQPSMGVCTGFLVGEKHLITAGHCMIPTGVVDNERHPFCDDFEWIFDYNIDSKGRTFVESVPANKRYGCKNVIRAENIEKLVIGESLLPGNDFAIIELDRAVEGIKPLKIAKKPAKAGEFVFTIGHPTGLPAKFSGFSKVIKINAAHFFSVNLDTQGGNSGGPVFNRMNEVVGILVAGHSTDYIYNKALRCYRPNKCDNYGSVCKAEKSHPDQDTANFVQKIDTLLQYLPSAL